MHYHNLDAIDRTLEAAARATDVLPEKGQELLPCQSHRFLANVYRVERRREKAIHHFQAALKLHQLPTGRMSPFGFATSWRGCFMMKMSSHRKRQVKCVRQCIQLRSRLVSTRQVQRGQIRGFSAVKDFEKIGTSMNAGGCEEVLKS